MARRSQQRSPELGQFYKLITFHNSIVVEDRGTGQVVHVLEKDVGPAQPMLFVYVSDLRHTACFLISEFSARLTLPPTLEGVGVIPLGMALDRSSGTTSLYDPDGGMWVCAAPLAGAPEISGRLVIARRHIKAFERLTLVALGNIFVPPPVTEKAARLETMLSRPLDLDLLRDLLPGDSSLLEAVARLCPSASLEGLARSLLHSPEGCRVLARLYPDDIMGQHGLPALADWVKRRDTPVADTTPARRGVLTRLLQGHERQATPTPPAATSTLEQALSPKFDALSSLGFAGAYVSLPHACTALARRTVEPSQNLCIVATARNEGIYILEWLAYHRAIGVQTVYLYTNDNDDGSDDLLSCLARAGILHLVRNQVGVGGSAQSRAYGHALGLRPDILDYRWALIIDIDEYLLFNPSLFGSAVDYLRWQETSGCDAIALNWVVHSSASAARWHDDFIARRFPYPVEPGGGAGPHIKTLCRPRRFIHSTPHYPWAYRNAPFNFAAANGEPHLPASATSGPSFSAKPNADFAWINHYFYKSAHEFLWKWSRNRGSLPTLRQPSNAILTVDFVQNFMRQFSAQHPPQATPDQCAPGFENELARLNVLPGVAAASACVKEIYAQRIQTLIPMFASAPAILESGDVGQAFLKTLGL